MAPTAEFPVVEWRIAGFTPNQNAHAGVARLVEEAFSTLDLSSEDVRRIIVTDSEGYGRAIGEFDPKAGFTNDAIYRGVGKIIPIVADGRYAGSNVVFHHCVISSFAAGPSAALSAGEIAMMRYTFFHEFGHGLDYRLRPSQHAAPPPENTESVALRCLSYNAEVFLCEYAACFYSARFLTPDGFRHFGESTRQNLEAYLSDLTEKRGLYRDRLVELLVVRDQALTAFWRGLIEYGKMCAFVAGNPELDISGLMTCWPVKNQVSIGILRKLADNLRAAWDRYPAYTEDFVRLVGEAWFALTSAEGYRFEVRPEGDYLWLS